jgi:glycosyltransferase involved in cell wall biosynthesis
MRRVVIVHDYLTQRGGAERVVLALLDTFPDARLVTSVWAPDRTFPEFRNHSIETLLPKLRFVERDARAAFPLLATAFSRHRISDADAVICSSSGWAHGVSTTAPKVVYCYTPARWLYEPDDYFGGFPRVVRSGLKIATRPWQRWDRSAAHSARDYVAISTAVRDRIRRVYDLPARIVHPPTTLDPSGEQSSVDVPFDRFLLTVARRRGYKNSLAVEAAAESIGEPLVVVGSDTGRRGTVTFGVRDLSDAQLRWLYANARALVAASREDFGLTPVEAMTFGKPAVALRAGGYLDSVVEGVNGTFFGTSEPAEIAAAIRRLDDLEFDPASIANYANRFSPTLFADTMRSVVDDVMQDA